MSIPNPYAQQGVVIPTTTTTTCVPNYQSITLQTGNKFILPPGATIVSVSDDTKIQSDCADLSQVEVPQPYCFKIVSTEEDGATTPVFKKDNVNIDGLYVSTLDTYYGFANQNSMATIQSNGANAIASATSIGPLLTNFCTVFDEDGMGDRGEAITICFDVIPSIGDNLFLRGWTSALLDPDFTFYFNVPATKYNDTQGQKCP